MQSSEPLISHDEAAPALAIVRNINDSDFDFNTQPLIRDPEGLTDTTFALVTYRVQLAGRVLHFPPAHNTSAEAAAAGNGNSNGENLFPFGHNRDWSNCASTNDMKSLHSASLTPTTTMLTPDPDWRQRHVRQFEQEALSLLHYCDPESSTYAWFTWHSTQCLISAVRLAAAQRAKLPRGQLALPTMPLAFTRSTAVPEIDADPELLQRALHHLEEVKVMHTNPRGAGYRWSSTFSRNSFHTPNLLILGSNCRPYSDMQQSQYLSSPSSSPSTNASFAQMQLSFTGPGQSSKCSINESSKAPKSRPESHLSNSCVRCEKRWLRCKHPHRQGTLSTLPRQASCPLTFIQAAR